MVGRMFISVLSPEMLEICSCVSGLARLCAVLDVRTSATRREPALGGTTQVSVNWDCPPLLYTTLYAAGEAALVVGTSCTRRYPFTICRVTLWVRMLLVSAA